ncbi:MAG: response regulator transcription factor [Polyangiales bacterium]
MIRVFIADDHGVVRAGVRALLAEDPEIEVVGETADADGVMELLTHAERPVDVLILDLSLRGTNGLDLLRRARALRPALAVLVHTMYAASQYADRMLAEGAAGYLCKDRSEEQLLDAVRAAARGVSLPPRRAADGARATEGHHSLTARELQVFMMVAAGSSVSEVANALGVGITTVSTHLGKVREKLHVQTVGEVVAYAHRHGLIG